MMMMAARRPRPTPVDVYVEQSDAVLRLAP